MKADVETLVGLLVETARSDESGKSADVLLGQIERLVIQRCDDPYTFSEIGEKMFGAVKDLPVPAALAKLAIFNGARRLPFSEERKCYLSQLIVELTAAIGVLPDSSMKDRCQSLLDYHRGAFYGDYGYFNEAAEAQRRSAEAAAKNDNAIGVAIGSFMKAVYSLKQLLFVDGGEGVIFVAFRALEEMFARLREALQNSSLQVQWAEGNGPVFMLEACVWLDRDHPDQAEWLKTVVLASRKLGGSWDLIRSFVWAIDADTDCLLEAHAKTNDDPERIATCLLILARHALSAGDCAKTKAFVDRMPRDPKAKHVVTIARRLLESK